MKRGTYVLRSTYQKVAAERDRLLADIKIMTKGGKPSPECIQIATRWHEKFKRDEAINKLIKEVIWEAHTNEVKDGKPCTLLHCPIHKK